MELRDLRAFAAVVRLGSFTQAAAELGYTQSAVSQQVASLEGALGQRLIERRPVRPTPAGARLAEHAGHVLLRLDVARSELAQWPGGQSELVVASSPLASPRLLGRCLRALRATRPELGLALRTMSPAQALRAVAGGDVDVALVDGIAGPNEPLHLAEAGLLSSLWFSEAPLVVALPPHHPLARRRRLDLEALVDAPWVVVPGLGRPGTIAVGTANWHQNLRYEGTDLGTVLELVASDLGAALLPSWACEAATRVVAVPLGEPRLVHRTELLSLRSRSAARQQLLDELVAAARPA